MSTYPRAIYQPPASRPHWVNNAFLGVDLQYLSWGWRTYGRDPIPTSFHSGWIYQLILTGRAKALVGEKHITLKAGSFIIIDPGCSSGWRAAARNERCKILSWIWQRPPALPAIQPDSAGYRVFDLRPEEVKQLERLHSGTRNEIKLADAASTEAVRAIQSQIDVLLARSGERKDDSSPARTKLRNALAWLEAHPEELRPAAALADYLQVSASTLNRLFRQELGKNVRELAYAARMKVARASLVEEGMSVKEIAFRLGYSHANDFTRAYSRFWGKSPSQMQQSASGVH